MLTVIWALLILLPIHGGLYLGLRQERESAARLYRAILETRRRQPYRRLRGK